MRFQSCLRKNSPSARERSTSFFCSISPITASATAQPNGFPKNVLVWIASPVEAPHECITRVVPDLMCLGKGMANGFPISACIGSSRVMHSWGASTGDAIHTSTFLGNPLGCAVALAVIGQIEEAKLVDRSRNLGDFFRKELWKLKEKHAAVTDVRGSGLMIGMEFLEPSKAKTFMEQALRLGIVLLPSGEAHNVISITPPFVITEKEIAFCVRQFDKILSKS